MWLRRFRTWPKWCQSSSYMWCRSVNEDVVFPLKQCNLISLMIFGNFVPLPTWVLPRLCLLLLGEFLAWPIYRFFCLLSDLETIFSQLIDLGTSFVCVLTVFVSLLYIDFFKGKQISYYIDVFVFVFFNKWKKVLINRGKTSKSF